MKLDNQMKVLFPKHEKLALETLNFVRMMEKKTLLKKAYRGFAEGMVNYADSILKRLTPGFTDLSNKIMFIITKKADFHPDAKKMIESQIKAWNNSSIVGG
jgi:hypothetical protein